MSVVRHVGAPAERHGGASACAPVDFSAFSMRAVLRTRLAEAPGTMHRAFSFVASAALVSFVAACSGSSNTDLNDPRGKGATTTSTSSGGTNATGSSSTDTSPTDSSPDTTPPTSGPVVIKNLSFSSATSDSSSYKAVDVTFAIEKKTTAFIDRVQEISLTFGGDKVTFPMTGCTGSWFEGNQVVTLHVEDSGGSSRLEMSCIGTTGWEGTTMPWGDKVTLEVKGLLGDATPWKASASGTR